MGSYRFVMSDELEHHGILGMKWGKRNGPPYPLDDKAHSSSENKAGWKQSLEDTKTEKKSIKAPSETRVKKLTPEQKAKVKKVVSTGAKVAAVSLTAIGTYQLAKSGKLKPVINAGKKYVKSTINRSVKEAPMKFQDGIVEAVGKVSKGAGFAIAALGIKEVMDVVLGENAYKVVKDTYNANHRKDKIDFERRKYDDEDDD